MEKLLIIDGNSLFNRAYYSTPLSFKNSEGTFTNAVYGFTTMLFKAITDIKPTHIAVAFDLKAPTFRHKKFDGYKATRNPMPDELRVQVPLIKEMLKTMKISIFEIEGFEADDIAGTLAKTYENVVIITSDNDYLQLVSDTTQVYLTKKGLSEIDIKTPQTLLDSHGLAPYQIIELKGLMGDSSDNIPGVKGVGEKTALSLLEKYTDIDGVYAHIDEIKGKLQEKLIADKQMAYLSRELATICTDVPLNECLSDMQLTLPFNEKVYEYFLFLGFKSLLNRTEFFPLETIACEKPITLSKTIEINTMEELNQAVEKCLKGSKTAIDIDTLTFASSKEEGFQVMFKEPDLLSLDVLTYEDSIKAMKNLFEKKSDLVIFNAKSVKHKLKNFDIDLNKVDFDLMLIKYVCSQASSVTNLSSLLSIYNLENGNIASNMLNLLDILFEELKSHNQENLYYEIELPLSDILFDMEECGFMVDESVLLNLREEYTATISSLTQKIHDIAKEPFNINSPKQLGEILFEKLNLPSPKKTKRGYSTDADTLEQLVDKNEIIPLILEYRQVNKLLSTYVEGLLSPRGSDGKVRTEFNQALTTTGRLSSKEPNLQNIPIRTKMGRVLRKPFVPSTQENVIISADYSQIELRLLAHFAEDEILIDAYKNDKDIHKTTASQVFDVPFESVTQEMRAKAKSVNFGIIYGISAFGLAKQIKVTTAEAKKYIDKYFEEYPTVKDYMKQNVEFCKKTGYVQTITKRRRYIPEIHSSNFVQRSFGERASMNMPLQGSAADIIKIAMIKVYNALKEAGLKSKLILQVHDELIIDCVKSEKDKVVEILKEQMENAVALKVPLTVNIAVGENWYEAK